MYLFTIFSAFLAPQMEVAGYSGFDDFHHHHQYYFWKELEEKMANRKERQQMNGKI